MCFACECGALYCIYAYVWIHVHTHTETLEESGQVVRGGHNKQYLVSLIWHHKNLYILIKKNLYIYIFYIASK